MVFLFEMVGLLQKGCLLEMVGLLEIDCLLKKGFFYTVCILDEILVRNDTF